MHNVVATLGGVVVFLTIEVLVVNVHVAAALTVVSLPSRSSPREL